MRSSNGLRAVAGFEAAKGAVVLAAGLGLLLLVHRDLQHGAELLVRHFHLNPAARTPRIFLHLAEGATTARLLGLAAGAGAYAALRFAEAYGLWHGRPWAAWIAVISCGLYLPVEIGEFAHDPGWTVGLLFVANLAIFGYLTFALLRHNRILKNSA
jgi:uncharacterized membrane protein (DUF2068 family)